MSHILDVQKVTFAYETKEVFRDISFKIDKGEIFCLLGPNGCGKTTLLDCIMDIHQQKSGEIFLQGKSAHSYKRHELAQHVAYVPQIHDITFPYTVKEVVLMGRTAYTGMFGEPQERDEEIALEMLDLVGMLDYAEQPYSKISGGEVKLVLLARALGQQSELIIMDEPTAHLDFRNELLFLESIVNLCSQSKITVLMVTHSPNHAYYFAEKGLPVKVAMLNQGKMIAYGGPYEVLTEENLQKVYRVKVKIGKELDGDNHEINTMTLLKTI